MSERSVGKPWTPYEDNLLIQAVAIHGENDNWKAVALSVPGRTNKACRKRWLHSLSPNVKKTAWTPEEDQLLLSLYAIHGTKWSVIARHIPGRTDDACSKRYREALDPSLKRCDWTADEDVKLLEAYARLGGKWGLIGQELSRSGLGCRNRWRMLERKRVSAARDNNTRGELSSLGPTTASQWTPGHAPIQEAQSWDGRSPQYVTPSMLMNNSPDPSQEARTPVYRPDEILCGAHLVGGASTPTGPHQFQYESSSINGGLSPPASTVQSPNSHEYFPEVSRYSPRASPRPVPNDQAGASGSGEHRSMSVPRGSAAHAVQEALEEEHDHRHQRTYINVLAEHDTIASRVSLADEPGLVQKSPSPTAPGIDNAQSHRAYYRTDAEKARRPSAPRKPFNSQRPTRLSSLLPATADASVLAYACGHRDCWPADASNSKSAFATSKELSDHSNLAHNGDLGGNKPFRCGLAGCEKSWKSINGLQYHLQISKVHFQQALAARQNSSDPERAPAQSVNSQAQELPEACSSSSPSIVAAAAVPEAAPEPASVLKQKRKLHPCPHPGCSKQYKQLSGLRYHLSHGHASELPMQLDIVPPTLARMVAEKGQIAAA